MSGRPSNRVGIFWETFDPDVGQYGRYKQSHLYINLAVWELNEEQMTEDEALFASFYNNQDVVSKCNTMSIEELLLWEEDLRKIVLEAKATQQRVTSTRKDRVAKLSKEERDKLITNPDGTVSEAINAVKVRKDRMTAADKLNKLLAGMGIENSADIMKNIKVDETKQAIHNNTLAASNGNEANEKSKETEQAPVEKEPERKIIAKSNPDASFLDGLF